MKLTLGGVRGTKPVADYEYMEFGGETTTYLISDNSGNGILIDLGSGIRVIDPIINNPTFSKNLLSLITHYHIDHIIGVPFFGRVYNEEWSITIAGPTLGEYSVEQVIRRIASPPLWPLQLKEMHAKIQFKDLAELSTSFKFDYLGWTITWCKLHHPGGCISYRIDEHNTGHSLVVATDVEWGASLQSEKEAFFEFCSLPNTPDILVFDGHFNPSNFEKHRSWGHSSWHEAIAVANVVKPKKLIITHHDPLNNDNLLRGYEKMAKDMYPLVEFARQGKTIDLNQLTI